MGLFEMLRRREQAESVATPIGVGRRPPEVSATGDGVRARGAQGEPRLATVLGSSSPGSPLARLERRLAGMEESRQAPPAQADVASEPPASGQPVEFRDAEIRHDVLVHFHQLPPYQALLTVGPEAVYQLPALLHEKLVALDCGARQARLVRATMPAADKLALDGTAKAVKGALRARGYGVVGDLVAEPGVLKEILRNAGASGKGGPKGGPMQLFERWIALAVPCVMLLMNRF